MAPLTPIARVICEQHGLVFHREQHWSGWVVHVFNTDNDRTGIAVACPDGSVRWAHDDELDVLSTSDDLG